jgi:zinc transporter ZupT
MEFITVRSGAKKFIFFSLPLVLLAAVIFVFLRTGGAGLKVEPAAPVENLVFERTVLRPGLIELHVRNTSPRELTLAQIDIRDAFVFFTVVPSHTLPRLGRAVVRIPYPWVEAEAYGIRIFSSNSVPFDTSVDVATETKTADTGTLLGFTLIGVYVGVIPVFLGILWYPLLRGLGRKTFLWLMAFTIGLLLYLGIDATKEALEAAAMVGGPFQGTGLVGIGIVSTFLLLYAVARRQKPSAEGEEHRRTRIAFMIALGIGLHNLGEGLAIGASFSIGAASLGTFLVIGFILQNITEGLGIISPIIRQKPSLLLLGALGLLGGVPAIIGTWVGGLVYSRVLAVLFFSIGSGAVLEVAYEIGRLIQKDDRTEAMPLSLAGGLVTGMLLLYVTGLLIK